MFCANMGGCALRGQARINPRLRGGDFVPTLRGPSIGILWNSIGFLAFPPQQGVPLREVEAIPGIPAFLNFPLPKASPRLGVAQSVPRTGQSWP